MQLALPTLPEVVGPELPAGARSLPESSDAILASLTSGGILRRISMARSVNRSARTGRFVSNATVARWPSRTTTERVGSGTSNTRTVNRSAATGRFVTDATTRRNPGGTISQRV